MNHKAELALEELESMIEHVDPLTRKGRKLIQSILRTIELVEALGDEYADIESDLGFIRQQYSGYPPFPLNDVDYEDDEEDTE